MHTPVVASYCATFLKPEMLHIHRQITALRRVRSFVVCRERLHPERFPHEDVEIPPRARRNFVKRFWLKYIRREPAVVYRGEYGALESVLRRRNADLMHVYFGHTGVHLLPFIQRWPKPTVVSFHGMDVQPREGQPGYVDRLRELLRSLPLVMARSHSLAERLADLGCDPARIRINRTGIPMDRFPQGEREAPVEGAWHLVQACRLIEKKGIPVTLEAFAAIRVRHPRARLTIAGDGPMLRELEARAEALGVADAVVWAGFLDEASLAALYGAAHAFIHPSQMTGDQNQEGVPNAMLEAMATGLPVLATRHGGIPEAVTHGGDGLLVEERDAAGLADLALGLFADAARWREMGAAAAASVRANFEQSRQIEKLEDIYFEAIEAARTT